MARGISIIIICNLIIMFLTEHFLGKKKVEFFALVQKKNPKTFLDFVMRLIHISTQIMILFNKAMIPMKDIYESFRISKYLFEFFEI